MAIWSSEIKELERLYESLKGQLPDLEKELERLIKADDENMILLYSRRCLEVIITDLCECELKRPRKTEPLKGIIDKLHKEEKVPSHIITSMHGLNELSTYGAHPKDFDPEQVKPVLNNLSTIIKWYLKYKDKGSDIKSKPTEDIRQTTKITGDIKKDITISRKRLAGILGGSIGVIASIFAVLYFSNIIGGGKQTKENDKSIAVLPFRNLSNDSTQLFFCDGFMDDILNNLQKVKKFTVRPRTSSYQYRDTKKSTATIGKELNVNYLVGGSIEREGNNLKIQVYLIDAKADKQVWSNDYPREMKQLFSLQSEISKDVAINLKTILSPQEIVQINKKPTEDIEAYNLYLKGRYFWNKRTKIDLRKSITYFEEAIKIDTTFSLAYSGIADSYIVLGEWLYYPSDEVFPRAKKASMKAIELDYDLAEAHNALAAIKRDYEWDWKGAEKEYLKAIELNPDYPTAYQWYSEYLSIIGRDDEAVRNLKHAQELDPISPILYAIGGKITYPYARQFNLAIIQCQKALEIDSNYVQAHWALANNFLYLGRFEESIAQIKIVLLADPDPGKRALLGMAYALSGKQYEAELILNDLLNDTDKMFIPKATIARLYSALNRKEKALDLLEEAYSNKEYSLIHINKSPDFDKLRNELRFINLIKKMGFK